MTECHPIDANTPPPLDRRVLLWFIGRNAPAAAHAWTIGAASSHEPGSLWVEGDYRPVEWYSHWQELPAAPTQS